MHTFVPAANYHAAANIPLQFSAAGVSRMLRRYRYVLMSHILPVLVYTTRNPLTKQEIRRTRPDSQCELALVEVVRRPAVIDMFTGKPQVRVLEARLLFCFSFACFGRNRSLHACQSPKPIVKTLKCTHAYHVLRWHSLECSLESSSAQIVDPYDSTSCRRKLGSRE